MADTEKFRGNSPESSIELIMVDLPQPEGAEITIILPFDIV